MMRTRSGAVVPQRKLGATAMADAPRRTSRRLRVARPASDHGVGMLSMGFSYAGKEL